MQRRLPGWGCALALVASLSSVPGAGCNSGALPSLGDDLAAPGLDGPGTPLDLPAPADLAPPPDLTAPCPPGTRVCAMPGGARCIPEASCCTNKDCPGVQTCDPGGTCTCPPGQKVCAMACIDNTDCCVNADCPSNSCVAGRCAIASCADGVRNGNETDLDCGGAFCLPCVEGRGCQISLDCGSRNCVNQVCVQTAFSVRSYGGGTRPAWVASADLDRDGKPDVVAANLTGGGVSPLLGRGDATFSSVGSFDPRRASRVTTADLDADGKPDMVALSPEGYRAFVLLGQGDGSLAPAATMLLQSIPTAVAIADFNGDKKLDLVVTRHLGLLAGRGDGTFDAEVLIAGGDKASAVASGDLDGDGRVDLVVADDSASTVTVLLGDGKGAFKALAAVKTPDVPSGLAVGDLDGDNRLDLVVGTASAGVIVCINQGGGALKVKASFGGLIALPEPTVVDIDGDKTLDLVGSGYVLLGSGGATFGNPKPIPMDTSASLAVADYNKDGLLDVAYPSPGDDAILVLLGQGNGTFAPLGPGKGSRTDLKLLAPRAVRLADLNGDGRSEVLLTSDRGELWVWFPDARGVLGPPTTYAACAHPTSLAVGDLDDDRSPDVLLGCEGAAPVIYVGSPLGILTRVVPVNGQPPDLNAASATAVAIADFDQDGQLDVFAADAQAGLVLLGKGDLTFSNNQSPLVIVGLGGARSAQVTDLDGNGSLDLVAGDGTSAYLALSKGLDGNGQFAGFYDVFHLPAMGVKAVDPFGGDINFDSFGDLIVADGAVPGFKVSINTKLDPYNIEFSPAVSYGLQGVPGAMTLVDLDRDRFLDVVAATSSASVGVLFGTGKGAFSRLLAADVGYGPVAIAAGDVNGDGKADLAVASSTSSTVTILLNRL